MPAEIPSFALLRPVQSEGSCNIKVILTTNTPVGVKVRLDSCWFGEEKGYCHRYWFGCADSCAGGRVDQPLAQLFQAWRDEVGGEEGA